MKNIEEQIHNIQINLLHINIKLDYQNQIYSNWNLVKNYTPLIPIFWLCRNDAITRFAHLIDESKGAFNINKPIRKLIEHFRKHNDNSEKELAFLNLILGKFQIIMDSNLAADVKNVRNEYLAHNDLPNRPDRNISIDEISEYTKELVQIFSDVCNRYKMTSIPTDIKEIDSILPMLEKLKQQ